LLIARRTDRRRASGSGRERQQQSYHGGNRYQAD